MGHVSRLWAMMFAVCLPQKPTVERWLTELALISRAFVSPLQKKLKGLPNKASSHIPGSNLIDEAFQ